MLIVWEVKGWMAGPDARWSFCSVLGDLGPSQHRAPNNLPYRSGRHGGRPAPRARASNPPM
eukprot:6994509-Alexandrium_andersonii.AAC.1